MDVAKILVLLISVIYLMGWLRALLTPERVRAMMRGRSGPGARLMAVGLGAVTPFCSCSSTPLFIGFVEAGISLGVTLSFLIASPMVNQVAVVALAEAGFADIRIAPKDASREFIRHWAPGRGVEDFIASASIEAIKPNVKENAG